MKKTNPVDTKKSQGFVQNATDTFFELFLIFLAVVFIGGALYALFEGKNLLDGLWWAVVTTFTVGYGDIVPQTAAGRIVAGAMMTISVFVIVPLITARMAAKMIVNDDAWTDTEQKKLMDFVKKGNAFFDGNSPKAAEKKKK